MHHGHLPTRSWLGRCSSQKFEKTWWEGLRLVSWNQEGLDHCDFFVKCLQWKQAKWSSQEGIIKECLLHIISMVRLPFFFSPLHLESVYLKPSSLLFLFVNFFSTVVEPDVCGQTCSNKYHPLPCRSEEIIYFIDFLLYHQGLPS